MTITAWPFLIGRNTNLGYQTIVCPAFIAEAGLSQFLAETAGGEESAPFSATSRAILGSPVGTFRLIFRVIKARAGDFDLTGDELLRDRSGRSIRLIEGIVIPGFEKIPTITSHDLQVAHDLVKDAYRKFWLTEKMFPEQASLPFSLPTGESEKQPLSLIEVDPLDLRSRPRKILDHLFNPDPTIDGTQPASSQSLALPPGPSSTLKYVRQPQLAALSHRNVSLLAFVTGFILLSTIVLISTLTIQTNQRIHSLQPTQSALAAQIAKATQTAASLQATQTVLSIQTTLHTFCTDLIIGDWQGASHQLSTDVQQKETPDALARFFTGPKRLIACDYTVSQHNPSANLVLTFPSGKTKSLSLRLIQDQTGTWKVNTDILNQLIA